MGALYDIVIARVCVCVCARARAFVCENYCVRTLSVSDVFRDEGRLRNIS